MRAISDTLLAGLYAQETALVLVPIIKLEHDDWDEPVCLARNDLPVSHGGDVYQAAPFEISLPTDEDKGFPVMRWTCENVSRSLIGQFRTISGEVRGTVSYVLTSAPEVVEIGPFVVELTGVEYNETSISGVLTIEPILRAPFSWMKMTPGNAPGLF